MPKKPTKPAPKADSDKPILIRTTVAQHQAIRVAAARAGLPMSVWAAKVLELAAKE